MLTVGALVKTDEQEVINFLLTTEIIPLCLRIMESGSELSKTVCNTLFKQAHSNLASQPLLTLYVLILFHCPKVLKQTG